MVAWKDSPFNISFQPFNVKPPMFMTHGTWQGPHFFPLAAWVCLDQGAAMDPTT
jgi:hypothetical protein